MEVEKHCQFNGSHITLLIRRLRELESEKYQRYKKLLATLTEFADHRCRLFNAGTSERERKQLETTIKSISQHLEDLIQLLDESARQSFTILEKVTLDLESLIGSLALEGDQEKALFQVVE